MSCFAKNMDDILFVNLTGGKYNTIIICYKIHNSKNNNMQTGKMGEKATCYMYCNVFILRGNKQLFKCCV